MLKYFWALLLLAVFNCVLAQDVTATVCQYADGTYQFAFTGEADSWTFQDGYEYDLVALTAKGDGVRFTVISEGVYLSVYGFPDAPRCPDESTIWHPDAPSIPVPLNSDCAFIDIQDAFGHWSRVQSDGKDVLLHYGEALIGSSGQSTDPAAYRAIPTICF